MENKGLNGNGTELRDNDVIVITGAGGFIAGNLVKYFLSKGFARIRAVDKKPFDQWYQYFPHVENLHLDCSNEEVCKRV